MNATDNKPCKARQFVDAGKSATWEDGSHYFEFPDDAAGRFGPIHRGSGEGQSNYLLFDDDSVVNMVGDCVISVFNNKTDKFE